MTAEEAMDRIVETLDVLDRGCRFLDQSDDGRLLRELREVIRIYTLTKPARKTSAA